MKADRSEPFLQKNLAELGRKYRLSAIYAFGSRANEAEAEYQLYILRRAGDLAPWPYERWQMFLDAEV